MVTVWPLVGGEWALARVAEVLFVEEKRRRQTSFQCPRPFTSSPDLPRICSLSISTHVPASLGIRCVFPRVCWNKPQAMTTKGIVRESKSDVCAWLSKAIFLHEGLPEICNDPCAPELLGEEGSTCASSAFLMSLSALLLRMGAGKFSSLSAMVCLMRTAVGKTVGVSLHAPSPHSFSQSVWHFLC